MNEHPGNFWELSDAVLSCIEGANYADNKSSHNEFLKRNPYVAIKNLSTCTEHLQFNSLYIVLLELVGTFLLNEFFFSSLLFLDRFAIFLYWNF